MTLRAPACSECHISFDSQTNAWGATIQLSATGKRYIAGPTLAELAAKLNAEGGVSLAPPTDPGDHGIAQAGAPQVIP